VFAICRALEQPEALERLESQILQQEGEISNMENRACFALHCIQMETQLVYANMEVLSTAMEKLAEHERVAHSEVATAVGVVNSDISFSYFLSLAVFSLIMSLKPFHWPFLGVSAFTSP